MVSGSFAEWRGNRFVSHPSARQIFEWLNRPGPGNAPPEENVADSNVLSNFEVLD
jgi:hypothetical protein